MNVNLKKTCVYLMGLFLLLSGCSIKRMAFNGIANTLAPFPAPKSDASGGIDAAAALTGEDDVKLVSEVFPTVLKMYETLHLSNPKHRGLAVMSGSLYIMYANAFVQTPADYIPETQFQKKNLEYLRAKKFYLRGADYVMQSLDTAYKGFAEAMAHYTEDKSAAFLARCKAADVESLYWAGCGILGAFSLDPMDTDVFTSVPGAVAMLERAAALYPGFNAGAIWETLTAFYAAAPESLGGGADKAEDAYQRTLELSGGQRPSVYVLYAQTFCIPAQDSAGFDEALRKALEIDSANQPNNKLTITLSQEKARWLQKMKGDYFLGD
ncbi:TRAP transporter TatT component family protein [Treponema sp. OMZ 857]|uniref:TRAP transporter TatT component family protein n=1 Tax=Treponema sp. OMZ 857 TaxID=1643513 RepID=UPI0020A51E38|nr:TRAP transporter TatT component family protein [Treponema sp. OMZ 857]UTC44089.1 hypothetical protein E4N66_08400 [Treponema sp. OMZ 857]